MNQTRFLAVTIAVGAVVAFVASGRAAPALGGGAGSATLHDFEGVAWQLRELRSGTTTQYLTSDYALEWDFNPSRRLLSYSLVSLGSIASSELLRYEADDTGTEVEILDADGSVFLRALVSVTQTTPRQLMVTRLAPTATTTTATLPEVRLVDAAGNLLSSVPAAQVDYHAADFLRFVEVTP